MIEFLEISCQNFLSFQNLPSTNLLDLGLIFVKGKNLDDANTESNDAGKTNLFNLISWILYERLAKTGNRIIGSEVVNSKAKRECWGKLRLKIDEKELVVIRRRDCKGFKNSAEISGDVVVQGKRLATNEEIENILGMTYSMFLSSIFWAQGTATRRLTQLTDSEYKALFDELIGTEHFKNRQKLFILRVKEIDALKQALSLRISNIHGGIESFKQALKTSGPKYSDIDIGIFIRVLGELKAIESESNRFSEISKKSLANLNWIKRNVQEKRIEIDKLKEEKAEVLRSYKEKICSQCKQELRSKNAELAVKQALETIDNKIEGETLRIKQSETEFKKEKKKLDDAKDAMKKCSQDWRIAEASLPRLPVELRNKNLETVIEILEDDRKQKSVTSIKANLEALKIDLAKQEQELKAIIKSENYLNILIRAYGPSGMKSMRLEEITPLLNQKAIEYSNFLSGGALQIKFSTITQLKSGDIKERYQVDIEKDKDVNFQLSGGGMLRKADLIAAFALDEVRELITNKRLSLKIYDEATDGLDAAGEASFVELLRDRLDGTSFFVSHKSLVGENLFDGVWEVERENGISSLFMSR